MLVNLRALVLYKFGRHDGHMWASWCRYWRYWPYVVRDATTWQILVEPVLAVCTEHPCDTANDPSSRVGLRLLPGRRTGAAHTSWPRVPLAPPRAHLPGLCWRRRLSYTFRRTSNCAWYAQPR
jgi:hypothetical protein